MKVKVVDTNAEAITLTVDGEDFVLDKDTVKIAVDPDNRKSGILMTGLVDGDAMKWTFLHTEVSAPNGTSLGKTALIAAVNAMLTEGPSVEVFTPLTGVTIAPAASKKRRIVCLVKPAATIAALTITMPALFDGQIFSLTTSQIVTALTITANGTSTIQNAPTAGTTTLTRSWIYNAAQDTLFLI